MNNTSTASEQDAPRQCIEDRVNRRYPELASAMAAGRSGAYMAFHRACEEERRRMSSRLHIQLS